MFWNNKKERKEQDQIQKELQLLDDVFHRTINALERLEMLLEDENRKSLVQTSAGDKRDFHASHDNRSSSAYYDELAEKCNVLFKAAQIDDVEVFKSAAEVFVKDTLEWYAGRESLGYNAVDAAFVPIFVAITRQAKKTRDVDNMFDEYVYKLQELEMSIDEKYEAIKDMTDAIIIARHKIEEGKIQEARDSEGIDIFTSHKRGDAVDGFKRLFSFSTTKFEATFPAKLLVRTVREFAPDIASQFDCIDEETIEQIFEKRIAEGTDNVQKVEERNVELESKRGDVPFEIAGEKDVEKISKNQETYQIDDIYPQLLDAVKGILDKNGITYQDVKINII